MGTFVLLLQIIKHFLSKLFKCLPYTVEVLGNIFLRKQALKQLVWMEYIYLFKLNVLEVLLFSCPLTVQSFCSNLGPWKDQIVHMSHHEELSQLLKNVDSQISECVSQKPADTEACQYQLLKVKVCGHYLQLTG